jgi:hypothetical protein
MERRFNSVSWQRGESCMTLPVYSTAHDYFVERHDFENGLVPCMTGRPCEAPATFQIGWTFHKKVNGKPTEVLARRSACERHARIFAFKKGLGFPKVVIP